MTQRKTSFVHALVIAAAAAASTLPMSAMAADAQAPAAEQPTASPAEEAFKRADVNHDATLTKEEAKTMPGIASQFSELDKNADGVLSYDEFQSALKPAPAPTK
jgi:hypothetical protein